MGYQLLAIIFTVVQLNCENLFDTQHDTGKNDLEFTETGIRHWTFNRYWAKLNGIARTIVSCGKGIDGGAALPDVVALCEVENDTVMTDLTKKSLLRAAGYNYVMTHSADRRGMDVALLYSPATFAPIRDCTFRVPPPEGMRPTRDILYVAGRLPAGDTLHIIVVHAPSRMGGEPQTRPYRCKVAQCIIAVTDSIRRQSPEAKILIAGDFNDYSDNEAVRSIVAKGMAEVSEHATGKQGAGGTYRYQGQWGSLDHLFASPSLLPFIQECYINDAPFLTEDDPTYGGRMPHRSFRGTRYVGGISDHLPLVVHLRWEKSE